MVLAARPTLPEVPLADLSFLADILDRLLAGDADFHSMRPDIWKQSHPEAIRIYRQEERRDRADAKRLRRERRRRPAARK
jgi:hypothetical protein